MEALSRFLRMPLKLDKTRLYKVYLAKLQKVKLLYIVYLPVFSMQCLGLLKKYPKD